MKAYVIWFWLLLKRAVKKPAFLLFLLSVPLLSFMIDRLGQGENEGIHIGICFEKGEREALDGSGTEEAEESGGGGTEETEEAGKEKMQRGFLSLLYEQEGILQFRLYESEIKMRHDVEKGELDCGVFLREELWDGIYADAWQDTITLFVTDSSSMTQIVKEKIASTIFILYSEENYVNYIEHSEVFTETAGMRTRAEIVSFARTAYETHLLDGSTFAFQYHGNESGNSGGNLIDNDENRKAAYDFRSFPFLLRGILAVCVFLSGLSGLLTDWKDREEKRFVRFVPPIVTTMVNIWIPTVYMSAAAFLSLCLTGNIAGFDSAGNPAAGVFTGLGKEIFGLLFYQFLIVMYCSIIRIVLRRQETIAAAIPLLVLGSVICCPVWVRLAVYVPLFRVLEKLFPVTYYLLL